MNNGTIKANEAIDRLREHARKTLEHYEMVTKAGVPAEFPQWAKDAIDVAAIARVAMSEARATPRGR